MVMLTDQPVTAAADDDATQLDFIRPSEIASGAGWTGACDAARVERLAIEREKERKTTVAPPGV